MLGRITLLVLIPLLIAHLLEARTREHEVPISATLQKRQAEVQTEPQGCYELLKTPSKKDVYYRKSYKKAAFPVDPVKLCAEEAFQKFDLIGVTAKSKKKSKLLMCVKMPENHGRVSSSKCKDGIGGKKSISVYRVSEKKPGIESGGDCNFKGKTYKPGEEMRIPNEYESNLADAQCLSCECQLGQPQSCKTSSYCESGLLVACERVTVASGECCPTCECFHQGKKVKSGHHWVVTEKDEGDEHVNTHKYWNFTCQANGRATLQYDHVFCDCSVSKKLLDIRCKTICKKFKPTKTTRPPKLATTPADLIPWTFPKGF